MKIDIRNITDNGLLLKFTKNAEFFSVLKELAENGEYIFTSPVNSDINVNYTADNHIEVKGLVSSDINIACARCLEIFHYKVKNEFKLLFSDQQPAVNDAEHKSEDGFEIAEDTIGTEYYSGNIINLKDVIQEQVILALPHRELCNENCKGLCQKCGGNLNHNECNCIKEVGHPAFAALKILKQKNSDK